MTQEVSTTPVQSEAASALLAHGVYAGSIDLSGADLIFARLEGADLAYANLTRAMLDGANLSHARVEGANLASATLTGANFTHTRGMPKAQGPVAVLNPEPSGAVHEVKVTRSCALVWERHDDTHSDVAIRYTEHAEVGFPDKVTEAKIDADTARDIVALLIKAFGPGVLSTRGSPKPSEGG